MVRALGQASQARAEVVNSRTRLCFEHKRNTEHLTQTFILLLIAVMLCLQSPLIQAVLNVILTFVPLYRKQYVNIDMNSSMQAHFK